jgi:nucleoside-diphosphate-sugar epimerase
MKEKIFLTGGAGRIGQLVLRGLLEKRYAVRALVHRSRPEGIENKNLELVQGDILDQEGLKKAVAGCRYICHLAAAWDMFPPAVYEKENNQLFESIIRGTYNLLEAARALGDLRLFLYASTDAVYATGPRIFDAPITEDTPIFPSRFYALAKIACESMCTQYGNLYDLPWFIVRICWALSEEELLHIYSLEFWEESMRSEDAQRLKSKIGEGRGVFAPLRENGESVVDHIADPRDIAQGIVLGIEKHTAARGNICNLAGPTNFRYTDVIERLAEGLGVSWESARVSGAEPYELRNDRAEKILGYKPEYTMERMIDNAITHRYPEGHKHP